MHNKKNSNLNLKKNLSLYKFLRGQKSRQTTAADPIQQRSKAAVGKSLRAPETGGIQIIQKLRKAQVHNFNAGRKKFSI